MPNADNFQLIDFDRKGTLWKPQQKSSFLNGGALKPLPPPLPDIMAVGLVFN